MLRLVNWKNCLIGAKGSINKIPFPFLRVRSWRKNIEANSQIFLIEGVKCETYLYALLRFMSL